jgi:hypothetical protein
MKLLTIKLFWLSALVLPGVLVAASETTRTLTFDSPQLHTVQGSMLAVECPGLKTTPVSESLSLPLQPLLLVLQPGERLDDIQFISGDSTIIGNLAPLNQIWDAVTSSEAVYAKVEREHNTINRLGGQPLVVLDELTINGQRYADLLIFPVTVDTNGTLWSHPSLSISVGERSIAATDLLPRNEATTGWKEQRLSSAGSSGPDYLVVTSSALAESMQPLVRYKNETGYYTVLDTIESILSTYSGRDDAEKLRERLKDFYNFGGKYVLLAGDETILPIRYAYPNMTSEMPPVDQLQICDLYFADMTGNWNADGDSVWGERYVDNADAVPELLLGRLPINTPEEAANYIAKLIQYEIDPGAGNRAYLEKAFFFASDQMRDYDNGGQHGAIARTYPSWFQIDTISGVEQSSGDDPAPSNLGPIEVGTILADGFGIVNVVAHGRSDGFVLQSSGYNTWPKTYVLTDNATSSHGLLSAMTAENKPAFYYSLACNNGGFDMDQPPLNQMNPSIAQDLIGGAAGAVGVVAYSRWGWISSSYLLQAAFFDSLFAHPDRPAIEALYASKTVIYYYRDLVYGLNYFGDPTLKVYTRRPEKPEITIATKATGFGVSVATDGVGVANCQITLSRDGEVICEQTANDDGQIVVEQALEATALYRLTAWSDGACVTVADFIPALVTGVDDDHDGTTLPDRFALYQNYPNPFNPVTTISFDLPTADRVRLTVLNLLGQTVTVLAEDRRSAGSYSITWDGTDHNGLAVASGVYFYRLETGLETSVRKMILMK